MVAGGGAGRIALRASVMGFNKVQNQDWSALGPLGDDSAAGIETVYPVGRTMLLAVADGHGAKHHARSDLGARFAIAAFQRTAAKFFGPGGIEPEKLEDATMRHEFPAALVLRWRRYVVLHASNNPPGGAAAKAATGRGPASAKTLELYGTTLIAALVGPELFAAWQIGDGELFVAGKDGVRPFPLAPDTPDRGDEVESLCGLDAIKNFRCRWWVGEPPALVSVSTDGLSKSYATNQGITDFYEDVYARLARGEAASVRANLRAWLKRASTYSGDDTTLCALYLPKSPASASGTPGRPSSW